VKPRSWLVRLRSIVCGLLPLFGLVALVGCAEIDHQQRSLCEALVPIVEPKDARITLTKVTVEDSQARRVSVLYRVERAGTPERVQLTEVHSVTCVFAGTGFDIGRRMLDRVETSQGSLSETQLLFLNKRLVEDLEGQAEAGAGLMREGDARPRGLVTLDRAGGYFLQQFVNAGPPTALYALLAVAYSLVYGLTNRINLAFGEIATIGAFGALIGVLAAVTVGHPEVAVALPLALLLAFALAGGSGVAIGQLVFVPLLGRRSQPQLVATIGLAIVIQEFLARAEGVRERWLPPILAEAHLIADGPFEVVATTMQMAVTGGAGLLVVALMLGIRFSRFGRQWRAVADDRTMARLVGIDVDRVIVVSFALACGFAGLGGSILTLHYGGTSFMIGTTIGLKALVAAIIGGIGSLPGAVLGGLAIGLTEAFWSAYAPIDWRDTVVFCGLIVFLLLRPQGILGTSRALEEREERP